MELKDLEKMTVVELREKAGELEDVQGVSGMKKEQLIDLLCQRFGIERPRSEVSGIDKSTIKARMRDLKKQREQALAGRDGKALADVRSRLKRYRRAIRRHTVAASR